LRAKKETFLHNFCRENPTLKVKVNLSLYTPWLRSGVKLWLYLFLIPSLDRGKRSALHRGLNPRGKHPRYAVHKRPAAPQSRAGRFGIERSNESVNMPCRERSGGSITVAAGGGTACGFALITTVSPPNKNVVTSEMSHGKSQPLLRASRLRGVPTTWLPLLHQLSIHWLPKRSALLPHRPGWVRRRIAIELFKVTGSKPTDNKEYFRTFLCCVLLHLCSSDFNRALFRLVLPSL
jgi:hypothetical protein